MRTIKFLKKKIPVKLFVFFVFLIFIFGVIYFLYHRLRSQVDIYVSVSLVRPQNITINAPYNWIPYWMANSINAGDKEVNPFGKIIATVVKKDAYEAYYYGQNVYLLLKVQANQDKTGILLYKNKPLVVGGNLDLKLSKSVLTGTIIYVGNKPQDVKIKKLIVKAKAKYIDFWITDGINIGDSIIDNNNVRIAKIIDKTVNFAEARSDTSNGQARVTYDTIKRDLDLKIEITVKNIKEINYFMETQKVKINEWLNFPFPSELINAVITEIKEQ